MKTQIERRTDDKTAVAFWYSQIGAAGDNPWLAVLMLERARRFQQRLAYYYERLSNLPRRWRRRIQRVMAAGLLGAALLLAMGRSPTAHAATITVGPGCTLRDAITAANTDTATGGCLAGSGADTIVLSGGTYAYSAEFAPGSGNALPAISSEITIEGHGSTISRSGTSDDFRILYVGPDGDLTLNETTISGGSTSARGGGILNLGVLTVNNSVISGNSARWGGGISNDAFDYDDSTLTLNNSTVSGNSAEMGGGGISNSSSKYYSTVTSTLNHSTVSSNFASFDGGGISNDGPYSDSTLTLNSSTVSGNSAFGNGGGIAILVYYYSSSSTTLNASTVSGNSAIYNGGGIFNDTVYGTSSLSLNNSTVSGNSARGGGGISSYIYETIASVTLNSSTISGNSAVDEGGGISHSSIESGTTFYLKQSLISGNMASSGSEISSWYYDINTDGNNQFGHSGLTTAQALEHVIPGSSDATATSDGTNPTALGNILDTTLADNGGPTLTHALVPGSPAIDASPSGLATDQRGISRPLDGDGDGNAAYDIGAVEMGTIICGIQDADEPADYNFGAMSVEMTNGGSDLDCIRSTDFPQNHPDAIDGADTGQYWDLDGLQADQVTPATVDFVFNLTLPHSSGLPEDASVCKHVGGTSWVCDKSGADATTVWLDGISDGFSDWAAGDNVPTAVSLLSFGAQAAPASTGAVAALLAAAGAAVLSLRRLFGR